jgi:putative ABC transport system substrate-binding protein
MPVVGFLRSTGADGFAHLVAAFRTGLNEGGYVEGRNVATEFHWADDSRDRLRALVGDLVSRNVAVLVGNHNSALAAKAATETVPIVFASGGDPLKDNLVDTLNRPGGNVTGVVFFSSVSGAKRLDLLRQLVPSTAKIAVLVNPNSPDTESERRDVQVAAQTIGQQLIIFDVKDDRDMETAFATFVGNGASALLVGSGAFLNSYREKLVALAGQHRIPTIYPLNEFASAGGLMSYGASQTDAYREAGIFAGRILKGEKPADMPVVQSNKLELVINLKTAKKLGLEIPPTLLARADEVIE